MSKYRDLWEYVKKSKADSLKLTFDEIQDIAGVPIDHSFLNCKKSYMGMATKWKKYQ